MQAPTALRIAAVQHGDYLPARQRLAQGGPETYGGQRYSVDAQEDLLRDRRHLIISLDGEGPAITDGMGTYVHLPTPGWSWLPKRVRAWWRARAALRILNDFDPTHLLLRTNDIVGCELLAWANRRRIPTAVIVAARFDAKHPPARRFCALANDPNVRFVGNHNVVATRSLLESGLSPAKAVAWDFPQRTRPDTFAPKAAPAQDGLRLLFAGNMIPSKGVLDVVEAVQIARNLGLPVTLCAYGQGTLLAGLQSHPGTQEGWLEVPGQVAMETLLAAMRASWLVVVPTRPEFPEALPLTLIDALATRTPVILSTHPIFAEYFTAGHGVEIFPAGNAEALATLLQELAEDPHRYVRQSIATEAVWQGLQIDTQFHHLLQRFEAECGLSRHTP
jgi:glycosyltransferase involved in cell wall biosynthesis